MKPDEQKFQKWCWDHGHDCVPSTRNENMHDHIDFWFGPERKPLEFKGVKALRQGGPKEESLTWVEWQGVKPEGKDGRPFGPIRPGWVRGKAVKIVFEQPDGRYLWVTRKALEDHVSSVDWDGGSREHPGRTPYRCYFRRGPIDQDMVCLVPTKILAALKGSFYTPAKG